MILHNYGGVYIDIDVIMLRDFAPLLGSQFTYVWGSSCEGSNGAVMRMFKGSTMAREMLSTLVATPPRPGSLAWGNELYSKVFATMPFQRLPTCFFNGTIARRHSTATTTAAICCVIIANLTSADDTT